MRAIPAASLPARRYERPRERHPMLPAMTELSLRSATELAAMIAERAIGCRELLDLYIERIERHNPSLNAVVTRAFDDARAEADVADAARDRGERRGPLHGLPVTIKDSFETAGLRTTCGASELAD